MTQKYECLLYMYMLYTRTDHIGQNLQQSATDCCRPTITVLYYKSIRRQLTVLVLFNKFLHEIYIKLEYTDAKHAA